LGFVKGTSCGCAAGNAVLWSIHSHNISFQCLFISFNSLLPCLWTIYYNEQARRQLFHNMGALLDQNTYRSRLWERRYLWLNSTLKWNDFHQRSASGKKKKSSLLRFWRVWYLYCYNCASYYSCVRFTVTFVSAATRDILYIYVLRGIEALWFPLIIPYSV
jgi:hypothetical protein